GGEENLAQLVFCVMGTIYMFLLGPNAVCFNLNSTWQVGENLAQLMFSVMMTGYMFRNAQLYIYQG
ncbi:unnamed protein product, partial [Closterium sp. NIES-53]